MKSVGHYAVAKQDSKTGRFLLYIPILAIRTEGDSLRQVIKRAEKEMKKELERAVIQGQVSNIYVKASLPNASLLEIGESLIYVEAHLSV